MQLTRYPPGLISALEKLKDDTTVIHSASKATAHLWIEEPLDKETRKGQNRLNHLFDTHPPLDDRIHALRRCDRHDPETLAHAPHHGDHRSQCCVVVIAAVVVVACRRRRRQEEGDDRAEADDHDDRRRSRGRRRAAHRLARQERRVVDAARGHREDRQHADAAKQYGVHQADVVYEEVVEGGITRLAAIFNSHAPERVGPVRSVRKTDQSIVWPIGGIFVYSGGAQYAIDSINTAPGDADRRDPRRRR